MLISGSVVAVVLTGDEVGDEVGVLLCASGVLMQSLQMTLAGRLMSAKLDSFQLTFYSCASARSSRPRRHTLAAGGRHR